MEKGTIFVMVWPRMIDNKKAALRGLLQFLGKKFIIEDRNLKVSI